MIDRILESVTANLEKAAKNVDDKPGGSLTGDLVKTYVKASVERRAYGLRDPETSRALQQAKVRKAHQDADRRDKTKRPRRRIYGPVERAIRTATGTLEKRRSGFTGKEVRKGLKKLDSKTRSKMQKDFDATTPAHKHFNQKSKKK